MKIFGIIQREIIILWNKYFQYYLNHHSYSEKDKKEGLPFLRDKLFISALILSVFLGFLAYIPSIIISIKLNEYLIGIEDTIAIVILLFIFFYKKQSINSKKILYSINIYILAIILILSLGTRGPGIIILFSVSILITLFQSKKAGLISVTLNLFIFALLLLGIHTQIVNLEFFHEYTIETWTVVGINLIIFNTIIVLSVSFLVDELQKSFLRGQNLQVQLKKEQSDLLIAKTKSEESDQLKSAFLANMSHEIRTPMNGILGFADLLKKPELSAEKQQMYIDIIKKSGQRMLNLINDIMDISKIESGILEINKKSFYLSKQLNFTYDFFKSEAEKKGLKLELLNSSNLQNDLLFTDEEKFVAIITNLVNNAIKYTDKGSVIFGCTQMESNLDFFVKDTGIGISKDRHNAIFERFIQADIKDRNASEGTGLGLSISKAYVNMLGGKIWMNSEKGKGSSFYFTIPYTPISK